MKRDILSTLLLLMGVSVFAQPGITEPVFDETKDAKLIFIQDFESDWDTWTTTPVNTITQVEYYKKDGCANATSFKPWENPEQWQRGLFRDTTIALYNGVVITGDPEYEIWRETPEANTAIIHDSGTEKISRSNAMAAFGQSDLGGDSYFRFVTDSAPIRSYSNSYTTSTGLSARYVRYLAVHGLDIEEQSSYRLTFFVKANALDDHNEISPTLYADIMRGTINSEKPLTMGYLNDAQNYKYNRKFEYTKDHFDGEWEKVTLMTYYLTDSIAENYFFVDGYWWAEDSSWYWAKDYNGNNTQHDLFYIVQPKNFFVRLGFASNYTEFNLDNISLTKSTIGGIDYYQHMMRVDFGYQTNLKDLAREAYAKTKIDAVEIPGMYFDVWGLKPDQTWECIDIASAEYQGDGYMYLFTNGYYNNDGEFIHYTFDQYTKVLVSFYNPDEKELQLKYTGSLFPKADNIEWIKAGKLVENFYNEEAQLNPYVFNGIYSMYDRPPVMQKAKYEEGSFGLPSDITTLEFKFSREMEIDYPANNEIREKCIVYVGDEIWDRTWRASDSTLVLTRPSRYTTTLSGDYLVEINNIFIPNTQRKAEDVAIHYHFGPINRDLSAFSIGYPIWNAKFYDRSINTGAAQPQPAGTAAIYYTGWWTTYTANIEVGNGSSKFNAARLYFYTDTTTKYPAALFLSPRGKGPNCPASLYLGYGDGFEMNLSNGNYLIKFDAASLNNNIKMEVSVVPYNVDPRNIDEGEKKLIGSYEFTSNFAENIRNDEASVIDTLMSEFQYGFSIEKTGRYMIEIKCIAPSSNSAYPGLLLSDIELYNSPVCYNSILSLNKAVETAQARVALITDFKYEGADMNALNALIDQYKVGGTFSSTKPSDWNAAAQATTDATQAMKLRMDTVDLVVAKADEAAKKLTDVLADNANWAQLKDYIALQRSKTEYDSYPYSTKANAELTAFIKQMDEQIKALDNRIAENKHFNLAMMEAKTLIDAKEEENFTEYLNLMDEYQDKYDFDTLMTTDADLQAAIASVSNAVYAYKRAVGMFNVGTRRIKELNKLSKDIGSSIADHPIFKKLFDNLSTDDDYLADVYKAAIKVAIYEKGINAGELDLSPLLKNYYLYATPVVIDALDVQMPESRARAKYAEEMGSANVVNIKHQYQSGQPIWIILTQHDFDNLIPGWIVNAGNGGSNDMTFLADNRNDSIYKNAVFDATLALEWGSEVALSTKIAGLPAGEYEIGLDIRSQYDYSQKTSRGTGEIKVEFDDVTVSTPTVTTYLAPEYTIVESDYEPGVFETVAYTGPGDSTVFTSVKFQIGDNKVVDFKATMTTGNGTAEFGDFKMTFKPDPNFDYLNAILDAKTELARLLAQQITDYNTNSTNRDYCIYMDSITTRLGDQVVIPIKMKNENPITAFSFDLDLPTGMSYVSAELAGMRDNGHSLSVNNNNKLLSFACISLENNVFTGNDGPVIYLTVDISNMDGDYSIVIDNVEMVVSAAQVYNPEFFVGNVFVEVDHNPGDINRDSIISITDAVGVIQFITNSNVQYLDRHAADANLDKRIDLSDMNLIVDYVLGDQDARDQLGEELNGQVNVHTEGLYGIYIDSITADENSQAVIPIKMKNAGPITAYSFDVNLPSGVSFVKAELAGTRSNDHSLYSNITSGTNNSTVSLACLSLHNTAYTGSDGAIINLTVNIAEDLEGDYNIIIDNIEMTASALQSYNPVAFTGNITVYPVFDPADVNKDGKISIADAVGIVAFIINSDVQGLDRHAADANQDGAIDVTDVVWIINRVIGKSFAPSRRSFNNDISSTIALDYVLNTTSSSLSVNMEGLLNEITAVQFNVTLPNGVNLKKFSTTDSHVYAANRQDDGSYTVVCFSLTNSTFIGGGETVFEVEFDIDDSFQSAPVILNDIKLVTPDCRTKSIDNITFTLSGEGIQTGMFRINDDSDSKMYDLQGRQIENANGIYIRNNKKMMKAK